ncbi:MAG: hypothetical protein AAFR75_11030, partial [Pseudomonadota bacterium]
MASQGDQDGQKRSVSLGHLSAIHRASPDSSISPAAKLNMAAAEWCSSGLNGTLFRLRNNSKVKKPVRLLPSRNGWFLDNPKALAAASNAMSRS